MYNPKIVRFPFQLGFKHYIAYKVSDNWIVCDYTNHQHMPILYSGFSTLEEAISATERGELHVSP